MFLFLRLILGHFVGDTVLQPDEVYELKKTGLLGVLVHALVILASLTIFAIPYLKYPATWFVLIFAGVTHWVQDEIKLRHVQAKRANFIVFVVDQLIHILFLTPILLFEFAYKPIESSSPVIQLYNSNSLVIVAIGYTITIFLAAYMWEAFKFSYYKTPVLFNSFFIKYGMFERLLLLSGVLFSLWPLILIPLILRVVVKKLRFSSDLAFNLIISVPMGLFLKGFLPLP